MMSIDDIQILPRGNSYKFFKKICVYSKFEKPILMPLSGPLLVTYSALSNTLKMIRVSV